MRILIAVEDKVFGQALAGFVIDHKWSPETTFKIVHVQEPLCIYRNFDGFSKEEFDSYEEERKRFGKSLVMSLGTTLRMNFPTAEVEEVVMEGQPKEIILDIATHWHADLIVMGSHGRRGLPRLLLGSISQAVLAHAPCSVAIIRVPAQVTGDSEKETVETDQKQPHMQRAILA
jgi:nucleotide-binding universal stress UspA family protein